MQNHLKNQTSPYLLQHADNPVNWYPWCQEAFEKAKQEDKPVFLSIGYSTCHWCHVMALSDYVDPPKKMIVVVKDKNDLKELPCRISLDTVVRVLDHPTREYLLRNDRTTFYVCKGRSCQPPVNELD